MLATLLLDSRGLLTHLAGPDHGRDRHGDALPARQARRGAHDRRHLPVLPALQLRLLPAVRRRLHGPALPRHDAAVPRVPCRARAQALPRPHDRARGGLDHDDGDRHDHAPADRLRERDRHVDALPLARASSSRRSPPPTGSGAAGAGSGRSCWPPAAPCCWPSGRHRACGCPAATLLLGARGARSAGACSPRSRRPCSGSTTPALRASTAPATTPPSTCSCTPAPDYPLETLAPTAVARRRAGAWRDAADAQPAAGALAPARGAATGPQTQPALSG